MLNSASNQACHIPLEAHFLVAIQMVSSTSNLEKIDQDIFSQSFGVYELTVRGTTKLSIIGMEVKKSYIVVYCIL